MKKEISQLVLYALFMHACSLTPQVTVTSEVTVTLKQNFA